MSDNTENMQQLNLIELPVLCNKCKTDITDCDIHTVGQNTYCDDCYNDNYCCCGHCEEITLIEDSRFIESSEISVCDSCLDNHYSECDDCGHYEHNDNITCDSSTTLCSSCYENNYITCEQCNTIVHTDYYRYAECTGESLCESCYDSHYCECSECNPDICDSSIESHCDNLINDGADAILDYHPKIDWTFHKSKTDTPDNPFIGLELESEAGDDGNINQSCIDLAGLIPNKFIICHDGSLTDGIEVITTPHKYQALRGLKLKAICNTLKSNGMTSHDAKTCGFHIHVERKQWTNKYLNNKLAIKSEISQVDRLIQSTFNKLNYNGFIKKFSKRENSQIDQYCKLDIGYSRYLAVNLSNDKTIEFRIWNGSLNYERLRANLIFTLAFMDYMQETSKYFLAFSSAADIFKNLIEWIKSKNRYNHLVKYLIKNNLI